MYSNYTCNICGQLNRFPLEMSISRFYSFQWFFSDFSDQFFRFFMNLVIIMNVLQLHLWFMMPYLILTVNSLSQQIFPWYPYVIKYQNAIVNPIQTCVKTNIKQNNQIWKTSFNRAVLQNSVIVLPSLCFMSMVVTPGHMTPFRSRIGTIKQWGPETDIISIRHMIWGCHLYP